MTDETEQRITCEACENAGRLYVREFQSFRLCPVCRGLAVPRGQGFITICEGRYLHHGGQ